MAPRKSLQLDNKFKEQETQSETFPENSTKVKILAVKSREKGILQEETKQ